VKLDLMLKMLTKMKTGHLIVMTSLLALSAAQLASASIHFLFNYIHVIVFR